MHRRSRHRSRAVDPATLAWVLGEITLGEAARLPGGIDAARLSAFRDELVRRLRAKAMETAKGGRGGGTAEE